MDNSLRPAIGALVALGIGWWLHLRHFLPRLPAHIATHFDAAGRPNGWMSRTSVGPFDFLFLAFVLTVVIGSALLVRALPVRFINIPNREYWFAPERRRDSDRRLLRHVLWFSCLMVAFLVGVNHLVFKANLAAGTPHLSGMGFVLLLLSFLAALAVWVVRLYRLFPKPRQLEGASLPR